MKLYEILIPAYDNRGLPFDEDLRKEFLLKVADIAGGVTILGQHESVYGAWRGEDGTLFTDVSQRMRVACGDTRLREICQLAAVTFNQKAIMAYPVSDDVHFYGPPAE